MSAIDFLRNSESRNTEAGSVLVSAILELASQVDALRTENERLRADLAELRGTVVRPGRCKPHALRRYR